MRINATTAIETPQILLIPYCEHHVPEYHKWMQDEELRTATASELLTLGEEYSMQRSWRNDHDKLTFILCRPSVLSLQAARAEEASGMIGDINLFLFDDEDQETSVIGEIELMIARRDCRRQGYGKAALLTFLHYIKAHKMEILQEFTHNETRTTPQLAYIRVKINKDNLASISLFKSIGFELLSETANYFDELELRWQIDTHDSQEIPKLTETIYSPSLPA